MFWLAKVVLDDERGGSQKEEQARRKMRLVEGEGEMVKLQVAGNFILLTE